MLRRFTYFPSAWMTGLYEAKMAMSLSRVGVASRGRSWSTAIVSVGEPDETSGGKKALFYNDRRLESCLDQRGGENLTHNDARAPTAAVDSCFVSVWNLSIASACSCGSGAPVAAVFCIRINLRFTISDCFPNWHHSSHSLYNDRWILGGMNLSESLSVDIPSKTRSTVPQK